MPKFNFVFEQQANVVCIIPVEAENEKEAYLLALEEFCNEYDIYKVDDSEAERISKENDVIIFDTVNKGE